MKPLIIIIDGSIIGNFPFLNFSIFPTFLYGKCITFVIQEKKSVCFLSGIQNRVQSSDKCREQDSTNKCPLDDARH